MPQTPDEKRWKRILKVYGITREQYESLDSGSCPVCTRVWSTTVRPCVDHNHKTGEIRGLLCIYCNRYRVGRHHDIDIVKRIWEYLRDANTGWIAPPKPKRKRKKRK